MKKYRKWLVILLIVAVGPNAFGFAVQGMGTSSCGDLISAKRVNDSEFYVAISWIQGFVSGFDMVHEALNVEGVGSDIDYHFIEQWVLNYCRVNPMDQLSGAATSLVYELKGGQ